LTKKKYFLVLVMKYLVKESNLRELREGTAGSQILARRERPAEVGNSVHGRDWEYKSGYFSPSTLNYVMKSHIMWWRIDT